jgi:hypothetical protein
MLARWLQAQGLAQVVLQLWEQHPMQVVGVWGSREVDPHLQPQLMHHALLQGAGQASGHHACS